MITHAVININNLKTTAIMVDRSHLLKNCRMSNFDSIRVLFSVGAGPASG